MSTKKFVKLSNVLSRKVLTSANLNLSIFITPLYCHLNYHPYTTVVPCLKQETIMSPSSDNQPKSSSMHGLTITLRCIKSIQEYITSRAPKWVLIFSKKRFTVQHMATKVPGNLCANQTRIQNADEVKMVLFAKIVIDLQP